MSTPLDQGGLGLDVGGYKKFYTFLELIFSSDKVWCALFSHPSDPYLDLGDVKFRAVVTFSQQVFEESLGQFWHNGVVASS